MHPLETYLSALYDACLGGGVAETSGYAALANLLNEVGGGLKPKTRCILHPHNQGAGIADGGLYTVDQFERKAAKVAGRPSCCWSRRSTPTIGRSRRRRGRGGIGRGRGHGARSPLDG